MAVRIERRSPTRRNRDLINDYQQATDEQLMTLAQHADGVAFNTLMSRHTGLVWKLVQQYMGSLKDVDDVYQDICLTVWQKRDSWKPDVARFSTWLYRIVANRCIDLLRARKDQTSDDKVLHDLESYIPKADDMIVRKQAAATLMECLNILPDQQRRALTLLYYEDQSISDICDEMILSEDAVRSLLKRGKQKLRQLLPETEQVAWA